MTRASRVIDFICRMSARSTIRLPVVRAMSSRTVFRATSSVPIAPALYLKASARRLSGGMKRQCDLGVPSTPYDARRRDRLRRVASVTEKKIGRQGAGIPDQDEGDRPREIR